jgi:predicted ArsR family transcriptional regulator
MAAKTKKAPSPRQQEILDLIKGKPDITAAEIANVLDTSDGAIYQQISRLRAGGHLPKATDKRPTLHEATPPVSPEQASTNGHSKEISLEDHLADELDRVSARDEAISAERDRLARETEEAINALTAEQNEVRERKKRLDSAQKALTPA